MSNIAFSSVVNTDAQGNVLIFPSLPAYPAAGGYYSVTGASTAVVAASLAANTNLVSMRFNPASARIAYINNVRLFLSPATIGTNGGIPTVLSLVRFTAATPTGGTARTINRLSATQGTASDMFDVRDSNAALTVTSVVFGTVLASAIVPNNSTNNTPGAFDVDFPWFPELRPGDGMALQTVNVGPLTATWNYSYTMDWLER